MRKFRLKVGLDVDDVLFSCNEYAVSLANRKYNFQPPLTIQEITSWTKRGDRSDVVFEYYRQKEFFETQPVIDGAKEFVLKLSQMAEVFFITATAPEFMSIRAERLLKEFPEVPKENIIMGARKDMINLDVILDDCAHNIVASKSAYPVIMRRPWNQNMTGCLAVNDYHEFLTLIRTILESYHLDTGKKTGEYKVYALVGPSASGKTELINRCVDVPGITKNISYTTRAPRPMEVDGVDYHFITRDKFREMDAAGKFFEKTRYAGECYGSCKEDLEALLKNSNVLMAIDICGAIALKQHFSDQVELVFVKRPKRELIRAILDRSCSNEEKTNRILSLSDEYKNEDICDSVIQNNGTIEDAVCALLKLIGKVKEEKK